MRSRFIFIFISISTNLKFVINYDRFGLKILESMINEAKTHQSISRRTYLYEDVNYTFWRYIVF